MLLEVSYLYKNHSAVFVVRTYCKSITCGVCAVVRSPISIRKTGGRASFQLRSFATVFSFCSWSTTLEILEVPYLIDS
jgi:hypothetical protein